MLNDKQTELLVKTFLELIENKDIKIFSVQYDLEKAQKEIESLKKELEDLKKGE